MLEVTGKGERNSSLFDVTQVVGLCARPGPPTWTAGMKTVTAYATTNNGRFPDPLEAPEVRKLAYNVG